MCLSLRIEITEIFTYKLIPYYIYVEIPFDSRCNDACGVVGCCR